MVKQSDVVISPGEEITPIINELSLMKQLIKERKHHFRSFKGAYLKFWC